MWWVCDWKDSGGENADTPCMIRLWTALWVTGVWEVLVSSWMLSPLKGRDNWPLTKENLSFSWSSAAQVCLPILLTLLCYLVVPSKWRADCMPLLPWLNKNFLSLEVKGVLNSTKQEIISFFFGVKSNNNQFGQMLFIGLMFQWLEM